MKVTESQRKHKSIVNILKLKFVLISWALINAACSTEFAQSSLGHSGKSKTKQAAIAKLQITEVGESSEGYAFVELVARRGGKLAGLQLELYDYRSLSGRIVYQWAEIEVEANTIFVLYLVKDMEVMNYLKEDLVQDPSASQASLNGAPLFGDDRWDGYSFDYNRLVATEFALLVRQRDGSVCDGLVVSNSDGEISPSVMESLARLYQIQQDNPAKQFFWSFGERPISGYNDALIQSKSAPWPPPEQSLTLQRIMGQDSNSAGDWYFDQNSLGQINAVSQ